MQVNITSDGRLQLVEDTMLYPPLTITEVEALNNAIPAAQTTVDNVPLSDALAAALFAIIHTAGGQYASLTVQDSLAVLVVDLAIFNAFQYQLWGAVTLDITSYVYGPLTVNLMGA